MDNMIFFVPQSAADHFSGTPKLSCFFGNQFQDIKDRIGIKQSY